MIKDAKDYADVDQEKINNDNVISKILNYSSEQKIKDMGKDPIDYNADYQAYLALATLPSKPFGDNVLSFEDFVAINYIEHLQSLGFAMPARGVAGVASALHILRTANQYKDDIQRGAAEFRDLAEQIRGFKDQFLDIRMPDVFRDGGGGPPSGGLSGPTSGSSFNINALNIGNKPIEARLRTGIKPNHYGPYWQDAITNFSPLHITHTAISIATTTLNSISPVNDYFKNVLVITFQNLAQMAVSFNISVTTNFTEDKFRTYIDAVCRALNYYYFWASVLVFTDNSSNRNEGMSALRSFMSADELNDLSQLKDILEQMPIPPNLNHLIFWMNQTYRQSSLPGSPLLKLMPFPFASTVDTNYKFSAFPSGYLANARTAISTSTIRETGTLMAKVCPGWISGKGNLLAPMSLPLHDPEFNTLWRNLYNIGVTSAGSTVRSPFVSDNNSSITYVSDADVVDGAVSGIQAIYDSTTSTYLPSLLDSSIISTYATTRYTNRVSYVLLADGTKAFVPATGYANIVIQRGEAHIVQTTGALITYPFGTQYALNVNVNSIKETAQKLLEWLLSLDSVGSGVKALKDRSIPPIKHINAKSGAKSSSPRKGKRGKGKGSSSKEEFVDEINDRSW